MTMRREVATQAADRPHAFAGYQSLICDVCNHDRDHELHAEYDKVAAASRETAAQHRGATVRELGV